MVDIRIARDENNIDFVPPTRLRFGHAHGQSDFRNGPPRLSPVLSQIRQKIAGRLFWGVIDDWQLHKGVNKWKK
jgi:hypothetical protein